ncbi:aldose epimerase family protein [Sporosarcina pasteurii]|uniref:Aldose 1-epimerase n=1 Tax=Sporosarcina pasteurii TaxID=1474 RepID=A0A380BDI7_SPOPA|nr:aldose epimerase family protein [Sporosarcina pasteurii]MDS9472496.1 aldose epimerase family protein [Sporosarcina pasteurii]QBQ06051.1 galactose mutarotase [Sporosarcina pasteurii]SUI99621.1 Aldose 1-epimerase precursor [Sporosarcina pasteurii]
MNITSEKLDNRWTLYTLKNDQKMSVSILNFGGIITEILVPNREGIVENVVLKYNNIADYEQNPSYFGSIIGRVAGRIANGVFSLNDKLINLPANDGKHHLHGGPSGFHNVIWNAETFESNHSVGLRLQHTSPHMSSGYPGNLDVSVIYTLTNDNELIIDYEGISDQDTILTMTNHSYFNLSGNAKQTIHHHGVTMDAREIAELDTELIPTGKKLDVSSTPFDFREGLELQHGIQSDYNQNTIASNGYDHYFIFENQEPIFVREKTSGRKMTIQTNQPGVVMYTANTMTDEIAFAEGDAGPYKGVCFETQGSPASLEHPEFPSILLKAGEKYMKQTSFKFDVEED